MTTINSWNNTWNKETIKDTDDHAMLQHRLTRFHLNDSPSVGSIHGEKEETPSPSNDNRASLGRKVWEFISSSVWLTLGNQKGHRATSYNWAAPNRWYDDHTRTLTCLIDDWCVFSFISTEISDFAHSSCAKYHPRPPISNHARCQPHPTRGGFR